MKNGNLYAAKRLELALRRFSWMKALSCEKWQSKSAEFETKWSSGAISSLEQRNIKPWFLRGLSVIRPPSYHMGPLLCYSPDFSQIVLTSTISDPLRITTFFSNMQQIASIASSQVDGIRLIISPRDSEQVAYFQLKLKCRTLARLLIRG